MGNYITLGLNIALAVFVGFGIIFGLIRGLRKTASRGIFLVITSIILLFITIPITSALLKIKINTNFTVEENTLTGSHSIEEIVTFFVKSFVGNEFASNNPEFVNVITAMPLVLLNAIVYFMLFIICKYLFLPLNHLFYKLTFAPKKRKESYGFSSFNNDFDFDKVENELLNNKDTNNAGQNSESNSANDSNVAGNSNESAQINNVSGDNVTSNNNASDENNALNSASANANNTEDISSSEDQFGKDGLFIKKEIEDPVIDSPIKEDFDKPSKRELKRAQKKEKIKYKKHRLLGGLVGAFVGMFIMLNVCMPIYGIMRIAKEVNEIEVEHLSNEKIDLSGKTNGVSNEVILAYDNSIFYPVSKYLGVEGLSLAEFDLLTSKTINNKRVNLRSDITSLAKTIVKADNLMGKYKEYTKNGSITTLTQEQLNALLNDSSELLEFAKKVNLVDCVADYIIPVACSIVINNNTQISDNQVINNLAINAIKELAKSKDINVFDETVKIIDLASYLNQQGLLIKFIHNDFSDPIAILQGLDEDFGSVFTSKLFSLQTVSITMPYILNIGLNFLEQSINYGYVENEYTQTIEDIKTSVSNFVKEAVSVAKTIDTSSNIYLTTRSLEPLGRLLQTVKVSGIVNQETYKNLIDYAVDKLQEVLVGLLPNDLENYLLNEFVENIAKVDRWDEEMKKIASGITQLRDVNAGILGDVVEGKDLRQGTSINIRMEQGVFDNLGKSLDILESTVLFGAVTTKTIDENNYSYSGTVSLFLSLLDYADTTIKNDISDTNLHKVTTVLKDMKDNLIYSRHKYDSENKFWSYELSNVAPLVIEIYDMLQSGDFDVTIALGEGLDSAKHTTLMGGDTTIKFMTTALDIVQDGILGSSYEYNDGTDTSKPQVLNDKIYELFVAVKGNLNLSATKDKVRLDSKFWQNEFVYYKNLKNIAENSSKLNSINDAKVLAEDLDNISNSYTIPQDEIFSIVSFAIKDIKTKTPTDDVSRAINEVIDNIASRLNSEYLLGKNLDNFWKIEFDHLSSLMDIKFADEGDYKVKENLVSIGKQLDNVVLGYSVADDPTTSDIDESDTIRQSYIILSNDLRLVLGSAIPQVKASVISSFDNDIASYVSTALDSIKSNIEDVNNITNISFKKELTHMQTLSELEISGNLLEFPTGTDTDIQNKLNENKIALNKLGAKLDSIAYSYQLTSGIYKYTDKVNTTLSTNSKFITRQIIGNLISGIFDIAKVEVTGIPTNPDLQTFDEKEKVAFNNLITSIQSTINEIATNDKIMSWQRELNYVNTLVKLNSGKTYDINNVALEIGSNLDLLAFNTKTGGTAFDDIAYNTDNECVYIPTYSDSTGYTGNSLLIKRAEITNLMNSYLDRVKETISSADDANTREQKILINDIIANCTQAIALDNETLNDNTNYYSNYNASLSEISSISTEIENKTNSVSGGSSSLTSDIAVEIDKLLEDYQDNKPIMRVLLTRRLSLLILHKLGVPTTVTGIAELDQAVNYYNALCNYYQNRVDNKNADAEYYYTTDNSIADTSYPNPFVTLYNKMNITA